jgi:zinc protease
MQGAPVPPDELNRVKALLLRQIPLGDASVNEIARRLAENWELELPLDEPTIAAQRYIALQPEDVRAAFVRWMRPTDLVRVTQGPQPQ